MVSYVYGNDLISQNRGGAKSFYHVDGLGSTRALTNASGVVTDRYVYDAFGRTIGQVGSTVNVYLFAGEQRDANVGLDYLRARYLSVGTGRFYGRDPFDGYQLVLSHFSATCMQVIPQSCRLIRAACCSTPSLRHSWISKENSSRSRKSLHSGLDSTSRLETQT